MRIARILYPVTTLGPGNRVGIWLAGCDRGCTGCMSEEMQDLNAGAELGMDQMKSVLSGYCAKADGFTISGGEPFLQAKGLNHLVQYLKKQGVHDIIVYTGYMIDELKESKNPDISQILRGIAVLIDGAYIDGLNDGIGIRGSSNQRVHLLDPKNAALYAGLETGRRRLESIRYRGKILMVGVQ